MPFFTSIIWFNYFYPIKLGKLKANLLSLELRIRHFLLICDLSSEKSTKYLLGASKWEIGQELNVDSFTNYDKLGELIDKYNEKILSLGSSLEIGNKDALIKLRDALAHGRVFAYKGAPPLYLIKFNKPKNGKTKVEFMSVMSWNWFNEQIRLTKNEYNKVEKACRIISAKKP